MALRALESGPGGLIETLTAAVAREQESARQHRSVGRALASRFSKGRGRGVEQGRPGVVEARQLVLGVVSNPRTPNVRRWIRRSYMAGPEARSPSVLLKFISGRRGLTPADLKQMREEHRKHGDVEFIDASDFGDRGGIFSCIDKLFEWFPHAVRQYPGAKFYGKADDDSYVDISRLLTLLGSVGHLRHAYLGYVQYDSFLVDEWKHCGWSAGPVGAGPGKRFGCPKMASRKPVRAEGPFPFVVGALTVMGGDLAAWMGGSAFVSDFVARGRASQREPKYHWDCGYSDVTLGYVLSKSNLSLSLVSVRTRLAHAMTPKRSRSARNRRRHAREPRAGTSSAARHTVRPPRHAKRTAGARRHVAAPRSQVRDAMRDATYGAMTASKFVVAHHLRTAEQFKTVHAEAKAHTGWAARAAPCLKWSEVGTKGVDASDQLDRGMAAFGCCQDWSLCEIRPA